MGQHTSLRAIRESLRLTQETLAARCRDLGANMTQSRVSEFETGDRFPRPEQVEAMASVLGAKPERLYALLLANRKTRAA